MYNFSLSVKFKKDYKKIKRNPNFNKEKLEEVFNILKKGINLDDKYKNHKLSGDYVGCLEFHLKPDILVIYKIDKIKNTIYLIRLGSHSELF
ncbi:MAG: type II toxin-antitoxin system YafQ family toxin [Candidatus Falkowbacteria bacterium]